MAKASRGLSGLILPASLMAVANFALNALIGLGCCAFRPMQVKDAPAANRKAKMDRLMVFMVDSPIFDKNIVSRNEGFRQMKKMALRTDASGLWVVAIRKRTKTAI